MTRFGRVISVALVIATVGAAQASAATVRGDSNRGGNFWRYQAAANETNQLTLRPQDMRRSVKFTDPGAVVLTSPQGSGCLAPGVLFAICTGSPERALEVDLGDRNDLADASALPALASQSIDHWNLGAGSDRFVGGPGRDQVFPDAYGQPIGSDDVAGGAGHDTVWFDVYGQRTGGVHVTLDEIANDGAPGEGDNIHGDVERIWGTVQADVMIGNAGPNELFGGSGAVIDGRGGADTLTGSGAGTLTGGDGDDVITGTHGPQTISCGPGFDRVTANPADDVIAPDCEEIQAINY